MFRYPYPPFHPLTLNSVDPSEETEEAGGGGGEGSGSELVGATPLVLQLLLHRRPDVRLEVRQSVVAPQHRSPTLKGDDVLYERVFAPPGKELVLEGPG